MFLFRWIRWIKLKDWAVENKKIEWYTISSQEDIKMSLSYFSITVISYSENKEDIKWNLYEVWIEKNDKNINIIFQVEWKIREAFHYFIEYFWIVDINYIKPYWSDLPKEKLEIIINKLKSDYHKKEEEQNKKLDKKGKTSKKENIITFDSKTLDNLKSDIDEFIKEINWFLPNFKIVDPGLSNKLENIVWDLLKYKKTTNVFKLAQVYKEWVELSEKLYNLYYNFKEKEEKNKLWDKLISEFEIIKEYKSYKKVQRAKWLEKVDAKEFWFPWYEVLFYKIFWKFWINLKIYFKELQKKYELDYFTKEDIFLFIQFILIFLLLEYIILLIYKIVLENISESAQLSIYYMILNISIYWTIVTIWKIISKKSLFLSIIIMIILYIIFKYIKIYFAL